MEQIRKGNDIKVYWEIITGGDGSEVPYELEGKALELYAQNAYEKVRISDFVANGNVIEWTFYGKDQKTAGVYSLTLIENNGSEGMRTVDECNAFELVTHSCKAGGDAESRVSIETVRLRSVMTLSDVVPDKELNKNSTNVVENGAIAREFENQKDALAKKQDIIPDLAIIREGASKGATALQEHQDISGKADTSGRYPDMSVGFADDLVGRGESVPAEFSFRASGGKSIKDGSARIKRLKGNSVVWNNLYRYFHAQQSSLSENGNLITIIPSGEYPGVKNDDFPFIVGHKYICIAYRLNGGELYINAGGNYDSFTNVPFTITKASRRDVTIYTFGDLAGSEFVITRPQIIDLTLMFGAGNEPTTIEEFNARKPIVADEYAYNEGEVIHMTAEGIKSIGDNAWDEEWELGYINPGNGNESDSSSHIRSKNYCRIIGGEEYYLKHTTGGDGTDANMFIVLYDENHSYLDYWGIPEIGRTIQFDSRVQYFKVSFRDTYGTTYKNDVMISLMHSGWKADTDAKYQPYWEDRLMFDKRIKDEFPDGMSKWDMVYNKNGKGYIVHGLGVEDMGDLNWAYSNNAGWGTGFYADMIAQNNNSAPIVLSDCYLGVSADSIYGANVNADKIITIEDGRVIRVHDSAYTDAASFKAAMAGIPFYYQLAEPTIIEYDEPFNLDYKVADFGTEEIIAPQPSAPISADIIYQFNAVDMIREHELEITELQRIIATMQAQLTSLTSNNGGQ
jgi:hypothetical protein